MSNQLIKKTSRRITAMDNYNGVCHECNSPIRYDGNMTFIEVEETATEWCVIPTDIYECPHCGATMRVMRIYKSLEISKELVKHE